MEEGRSLAETLTPTEGKAEHGHDGPCRRISVRRCDSGNVMDVPNAKPASASATDIERQEIADTSGTIDRSGALVHTAG